MEVKIICQRRCFHLLHDLFTHTEVFFFFNSVAGITMREEAKIHIFPGLEKRYLQTTIF